MSNTPFYGLIRLCTYQIFVLVHPFFYKPFFVGHDFLFLISFSFLRDMIMLLLLTSGPVGLRYLLFWCICLLTSVLLGVHPCLLVDPHQICRQIIQWAASPRAVDTTRSTGNRCIPIRLFIFAGADVGRARVFSISNHQSLCYPGVTFFVFPCGFWGRLLW